jgi:hypothetical protein
MKGIGARRVTSNLVHTDHFSMLPHFVAVHLQFG